MLSVNLFLLITSGVSFVGYCLFFDRKRLADPEYKRKLHERRLQKATREDQALEEEEEEPEFGDDEQAVVSQQQYQHRLQLETFIWMSAVRCLEHPTILKRMFESEVQLGDRLLQDGRMDEALAHLANAILLCKQPVVLLQSLQKTMPKELIHPLIIRVSELLEESHHQENDREDQEAAFSSSDSDEWISDGNVPQPHMVG
ncbi:GL19377 [Drosophila persimilis]|uniref:GL19377 n=1 Tax=Drosophila persimilis TaxID=7234 RepID=B4G8Y7_DROPE|nr:mitochondrial import receptor subunit TOM20 homolog B [Drosophila persimilis]EDW28817.1 GL19377 [Drosophila persimilis]